MKYKLLLLVIMLIAPLASMRAATSIERTLVLNVGETIQEYCPAGNNDYPSSTVINNEYKDVVACMKLGACRFSFTGIKRGTASVQIALAANAWLYTYNITVVDVASITLPTAMSFTVGDEYTFSPIIVDAVAETTLTWKSYNTDVATVDNEGKLTAVGVGTASIVCTAANGVSGQCQVTVNPVVKVGSVSLSATTLDMTIGETKQLHPIIQPEDAANKAVSWNTSDANIATVDDEGNVTAVAAGHTTITATSTDGSYKSASCAVNVSPIVANSVVLEPASIELAAGGTYQLTATVMPETAQQRVVWSSSDKEVAKVVGGTIYALDWGECLITATTVDGSNLSANCFVTVTPPEQSNKFDINGDGTVNTGDISALYRAILGQ